MTRLKEIRIEGDLDEIDENVRRVQEIFGEVRFSPFYHRNSNAFRFKIVAVLENPYAGSKEKSLYVLVPDLPLRTISPGSGFDTVTYGVASTKRIRGESSTNPNNDEDSPTPALAIQKDGVCLYFCVNPLGHRVKISSFVVGYLGI